MSKLFFDHLINADNLINEIKSLQLIEEEYNKLMNLIDQLIQQRVVEIILDHLHADHHETFITLIYQNPGDRQILIWLKERVENIEEIISQEIEKLRLELKDEVVSIVKQTQSDHEDSST